MTDNADDLELAQANFKSGRELMIEDCDQALPYLLEALRIDKTNAHYCYAVAECYYFLKNYTKAFIFIEEALQIDMNLGPALVLKSVVLDETGKSDIAKEILDQELAHDKQGTCANLFILANGRSLQHDFEAAVHGFKKFLAIEEPDAISLGLIICAFAESGRADEGLQYCTRLLELAPEDGFNYYCVALCFERKGEYAIALNWLKKAKSKGFSDADKEIMRLAAGQESQLEASEFKNGTYELYGTGEDGRPTLMAVFVIENNVLSYPSGGKSDIFPEGPIDFWTAIRLKRFLNDGHGYCLAVMRSA